MKQQALLETDQALALLQTFPPFDLMTVQRLREELMLVSTYDANAIEGSCLTLRETVILVKDRVTIGRSVPIRDISAACGYAAAFEAVFDFVRDQKTLTVELVKALHQYVMLGELPQGGGHFRAHNGRVLGASFKPAAPSEIEARLSSLVDWFNQSHAMHPIERASLFHATFETILPFEDGNGRVGRLLINFMLLQAGYWPINIRYAEDRERYYEALSDFNKTGKADALTALVANRAKAELDYCIHIARQKALVKKMGIAR